MYIVQCTSNVWTTAAADACDVHIHCSMHVVNRKHTCTVTTFTGSVITSYVLGGGGATATN